jgi:hypothetical protein
MRVIISRDAFRFTRRPAKEPYHPSRSNIDQPHPVRVKPVLLLRGIIAGDSPTAVMEGLPGVEGARVVREKDVIGGLRISAISERGVRVTGLDTVWVLEVREPWQ